MTGKNADVKLNPPYIVGYEDKDTLPLSDGPVITYETNNTAFSCSLSLSTIPDENNFSYPVTDATLQVIKPPVAELPVVLTQAIEFLPTAEVGLKVRVVANGNFSEGGFEHVGKTYTLVAAS